MYRGTNGENVVSLHRLQRPTGTSRQAGAIAPLWSAVLLPRVTNWQPTLFVCVCVCWLLPARGGAQDSSLYRVPLPAAAATTQAPMPNEMQQGSWTYIATPPPKQVEINDIVVVRVNELASMTAEGEMDRRKNAIYDAILKDWVYLDRLKAIIPTPNNDGDPRARGQLQELYRAEAEMQTRESLTLNIACHIADIRPNGILVLEGHKQVKVNEEVWEVSLSGLCRREDIGPDGIVLSNNVDELMLEKRERGHVNDSYRRGWLLKWMDEFHWF